jgi:EpsI family protein
MTFAQTIDRRVPTRSVGWSKTPPWGFAIAVPVAVLLALAGPAYAARLDALYPRYPLPLLQTPAVAAPWHPVLDAGADWRPAVDGADRELLEGFQEPGSGLVVRYLAFYRLRPIGNLLTRTGNRVADGVQWQIAGYGRAKTFVGRESAVVASAEIVSGQHRRLVWSFYVVDGKIAAGLIEAKLLQARAVLLERKPVAAFVAISANMDNPRDPAERQLARFLAASQPFAQYITALQQ